MQSKPNFHTALAFIKYQVEKKAAAGGSTLTTFGDDTELISAGLYDSVGFLTLLSEIEVHFDIELDLSDYDPSEFASIAGLARVTSSQSAVRTSIQAVSGSSSSAQEIVFLSPEHCSWHDLATLYGEMYASFNQEALTLRLRPDGASTWLQALTRAFGSMQCVVGCVDHGSLVGFLYGFIRVVPPHLDGKFIGSIEAVFVRDSHRGRGLAAALVQKAENWFASKGVLRVQLQVLTSNRAARAFWRKVGFTDEIIQLVRRWDTR